MKDVHISEDDGPEGRYLRAVCHRRFLRSELLREKGQRIVQNGQRGKNPAREASEMGVRFGHRIMLVVIVFPQDLEFKTEPSK